MRLWNSSTSLWPVIPTETIINQGDKPGDEAVFDGGGAGLVAQKLPKHFMLSRTLTKALWHAQVAG